MNRDKLPVLSDSNHDRRISNVYINPSYVSTISVNLQIEHVEEPESLSYRQIIRNSIQPPETRTKRRKCCRCKLLDKDGKDARLFIANVLLITLFVMTFGCTALSIRIRTVPLKFFPVCWKLAIALAFLTLLIGVYICWEDDICKPTRQREERLDIQIGEMQTFAANQRSVHH